jgi:hypothetical protein
MFDYLASVMILLIGFSSIFLSFVIYHHTYSVYASNMSCNQIINVMKCENQQNLQTASPNGNDISGRSMPITIFHFMTEGLRRG